MSHPIRKTSDGPWCWASKAALNRIEEAIDGRTDGAHVFSVYLALCRTASDNASKVGERPFTVRKGLLASRAGMSYTKCARILSLLRDIGLIHIQGNELLGTKEKGPNTYSVLSFGSLCPPIDTSCLALGTECPTLGTGTKQGAVPRVIEEREEQIEEHDKKGTARTRTPSLEAWMAEAKRLKPDWPVEDAQSAWNYYESLGWYKGKSPVMRWQNCIVTCYRNWAQRNAGRPVSAQPLQPKPARPPSNSKYEDDET